MRRTLIATISVLLVSLALCTLSAVSVHRVVNHARHLRTTAIEAMDAHETQRAEEAMVELANYMEDNEGWLEILCSHEDLHAVKEQIIDAQASIEFGIEDDFYQAISKFGERLEHIADIESVRFSNLY